MSEECLDAPLDELAGLHEALKAFIERRSQSPTGSELTRLPRTAVPTWNLHAGRHRCLTWHDETEDVVWLLGIGYHREGDRDDAYEVLKNLDEADRLFPTEQDYARLFKFRESGGISNIGDLVRLASEVGPELLLEAKALPGVIAIDSLGDVIDVRMLVEIEVLEDCIIRRYTVSFRMPPRKLGVLPSGRDWLLLLTPAFLPTDADITHWDWNPDEGGETIAYEELDELE